MKAYQTRKKFLIRGRFQLKYAFGFTLIVLLTAVLFGYMAQSSIKQALTGALNTGAVDSPVISTLFEGQSVWLSAHIYMLLGLFSFILIIVGVLATHRIAGPVFALNRRMQEMAQGKTYDEPLQFRKTDEFQELASSFNNLVVSIQSVRREELQGIYDELKSILENLKTSDKDNEKEEVHHLEDAIYRIEKQLIQRKFL